MKKRFRALASQSPAIVISVVALTFSLGGGAGYAASVATSHPATKITWHKLSLRNGWHSGPSSFTGTGAPSYTVSNGIVYLTGSPITPAHRRCRPWPSCRRARGQSTFCGSRRSTRPRAAASSSGSTQAATSACRVLTHRISPRSRAFPSRSALNAAKPRGEPGRARRDTGIGEDRDGRLKPTSQATDSTA